MYSFRPWSIGDIKFTFNRNSSGASRFLLKISESIWQKPVFRRTSKLTRRIILIVNSHGKRNNNNNKKNRKSLTNRHVEIITYKTCNRSS